MPPGGRVPLRKYRLPVRPKLIGRPPMSRAHRGACSARPRRGCADAPRWTGTGIRLSAGSPGRDTRGMTGDAPSGTTEGWVQTGSWRLSCPTTARIWTPCATSTSRSGSRTNHGGARPSSPSRPGGPGVSGSPSCRRSRRPPSAARAMFASTTTRSPARIGSPVPASGSSVCTCSRMVQSAGVRASAARAGESVQQRTQCNERFGCQPVVQRRAPVLGPRLRNSDAPQRSALAEEDPHPATLADTLDPQHFIPQRMEGMPHLDRGRKLHTGSSTMPPRCRGGRSPRR
ncbi:hypothetical protein EDD99_1884 [Streptomyces sp. 846.5]|nr:hypothetical protein EDD99_1884 [Streptomyces sp. 846.5]